MMEGVTLVAAIASILQQYQSTDLISCMNWINMIASSTFVLAMVIGKFFATVLKYVRIWWYLTQLLVAGIALIAMAGWYKYAPRLEHPSVATGSSILQTHYYEDNNNLNSLNNLDNLDNNNKGDDSDMDSGNDNDSCTTRRTPERTQTTLLRCWQQVLRACNRKTVLVALALGWMQGPLLFWFTTLILDYETHWTTLDQLPILEAIPWICFTISPLLVAYAQRLVQVSCCWNTTTLILLGFVPKH
jgi:hypothetical protein